MERLIKELELKLNRSLMILSEEIDGLKQPLHDIVQDIDKEREAMSMELERTKFTNR